jgi:photosystem II stability/assembly factor-like uncharacterized protein
MRIHTAYSWAALSVFCFLAARTLAAQAVPQAYYQSMRWRSIGPFRGGRVEAVAGIPDNPLVYYFGAVAGGIWKTTDGGNTWLPLFQHEPVSSIGAIAIDPSDANTIYVGTGEPCPRGDMSFGNGIYKSTDAGKTWLHLGLDDTRHIARIVIDPKNTDTVYVAALGSVSGSNPDRGVFRSHDGGKTWQKTLYRGEEAGAIDLAMDPNNPRVLFAALWQVRRTPWSLTSGGPGSALYKSTDGGDTWTEIEGNGFAAGTLGRIGVTVAANSSRIYAIVEANNGGLYRSDDAGTTWSLVNASWDLRGRPWYYSHIFADPRNAEEVYVFSFGAYRSTDAGKSFSTIETPHGDYHDLWIDPGNPRRMIVGNDGGATISNDDGESWTSQDNQPTGQFYRIATDNRFNYYLYGSQQDRGTVAITTRSDDALIGADDWYGVGGGESGFVLPSPLNPDVVYAGSLYSAFTRFDRKAGQSRDISPWPFNELNLPAKDAKYRFGWTAPMLISPHDPHTLYIGAQVLFKTSDEGKTWSVISPDLTRNDQSKQNSSGGPITQDNTTVEYFDMISSIAESPVQAGVIWVGTDDGVIQVTRNGGANWEKVTPKAMPEWSMVSSIEASPFSPGTAYASVEADRLDDFRPYVYRTADYGRSWTPIVTGLPSNSYVHAVREDPKKEGLLYAGTEMGIYVSFDNGSQWQSLQLNLPTAPIYDLAVHENDLAVATHGRAFWVLDDLTPLRQVKEALKAGSFYLYPPESAYRVRGNNFYGTVSSGAPSSVLDGQNPPPGAILDYYLGGASKAPLHVEILNGKGAVVSEFTVAPNAETNANGRQVLITAGAVETADGEEYPSKPTDRAGLNRFVWNLLYAGSQSDQKAADVDAPEPLIVPGDYTVRVTVNGKSASEPLVVREDPRVHVSLADLQSEFDLQLKIHNRLQQAAEAVLEMKQVHTQLTALGSRLASDPATKKIAQAVNDLDTKTTDAENAITGWKVDSDRYSLNYPPALDDQLNLLFTFSGAGDGAPGEPFIQVYDQLSRQLDADLRHWNEIKNTSLRQLNEMMRENKIPNVAPFSTDKTPE